MNVATHSHALDHGVRAFDPDLLAKRYRAVAQGSFRILRTRGGRYYACVKVETALGHLCAAIHLEGTTAKSVLGLTACAIGQPVHGMDAPSVALPMIHAVTNAAERAADALAQGASAQGTPKPVLDAARVMLKARLGDLPSRTFVRETLDRARAGDPKAQRLAQALMEGQRFARGVLGTETTGGLFDDIGHAFTQVVHAVEHTAKDVGHAVEHAVKDVGHAVAPVLEAIKDYGPMVLSGVQGLISLIPGIGTGISAAISAAIATLQGGGPLDIALHVAYGAIPIPPGIRNVTDVVLDTVLELAKGDRIDQMALTVARNRIPAGLPREVFDTLVHVVAGAKGIAKDVPTIVRNAGAVGAHMVEHYTQGASAALAKGIAQLAQIQPAVHAQLAKLPDPKLKFVSIAQIAPHLAKPPPRVQPGGAPLSATLAIEVSADRSQRRVVASPALKHLVAQLSV
jgi:hypothetical protein